MRHFIDEKSATRPKVLLTHRVHPQVILRLQTGCDVDHNDSGRILAPDEVRHRARQAMAIMVFMTDYIDRRFLSDCPRLRIVAGAFKGCDNIDVAACTERGVWVTCVPDLLTVPTAELAIGLLLSLTRNIVAGDRLMRSKPFAGWRPILYGMGLMGKCLGIYGMGAVGQAIVERTTSFRMQTIYVDPRPLPADRERAWSLRRVSLQELLAESDFIVIAAPLTDQNLHTFDDAAIARMRTGSFLINVGRGSVVDDQAVVRALKSGKLAGFATDVYEMEDQSRSHRSPQVEPALLVDHAHTVMTPHLGSAVDSVREQIELEAADNILTALQGGEPAGAVNRLASDRTSAAR
jgi:phosphonate dehydrogenase